MLHLFISNLLNKIAQIIELKKGRYETMLMIGERVNNTINFEAGSLLMGEISNFDINLEYVLNKDDNTMVISKVHVTAAYHIKHFILDIIEAIEPFDMIYCTKEVWCYLRMLFNYNIIDKFIMLEDSNDNCIRKFYIDKYVIKRIIEE